MEVGTQLVVHGQRVEVVERFEAKGFDFILIFPLLEDLQDQEEASASILVWKQAADWEELFEPTEEEMAAAVVALVEMGLAEASDFEPPLAA